MKKIIILIVLIVAIAGVFWFLNVKKNPVLGSASLSWNANSEPDLAGYKIYYGTSPRTGDCPKGGYGKVKDAGKNTKYNLSNLETGKTYYFSITSYNSSRKESCFSEEMKKDVKISLFEKVKSFLGK